MRYILIIFTISFSLAACKNSCEGFPEDELKWVPFEVDEKIKYSYQSNTLEVKVIDKFFSKGGKYGGEPFPEACIPIAWYQTDESDSISIYEEIELWCADPYMTTSFSTNNIFNYELRDGYSFNTVSVRLIGDTIINGIQLNEAFKIEKDSQDGINWFIKAANRGIISFGEKDSTIVWEQKL